MPQTDPASTNFNLLRKEGINRISEFSGNIWTDYNVHDPGITILEHACFFINALGYRLSFPIEDLLTSSETDPLKNEKQFFTASESLSMNPVTLNDYRRLLLSIDGVRNGWVEPVKNSMPGLYRDLNTDKLTFTRSDTTERISLKGLYRVILEKKSGEPDEDVKQRVKEALSKNRNVCEDFAEIIVLPEEIISMKGVIDLNESEETDADEIMARIYFAAENFIAPEITFSSLEQLEENGLSSETIFTVPKTEKGFIEAEDLAKLERKNELRMSDIMHIILDVSGVKTVSGFQIRKNESSWENWALTLSSGRSPELDALENITANLSFQKKGAPVETDSSNVSEKYDELKTEENSVSVSFEDISVPAGQYRDLDEYSSMQHQFPANYGIGDKGLPASASEKRKAQAKQLQAYLMFFDQILANQQKQLGNAKDLFSVGSQPDNTYFLYDLADAPEAGDLFADNYMQNLSDIMKENDSERKNRILDHLLARMGEAFADNFFLDKTLQQTILAKQTFLQNYPENSAAKITAFDHTQSAAWDTDNIAGLKQRICAFLAIEQILRTTLAEGDAEGFHMVENILLRPENKSSDIDYTFTDTQTDNKDPYSLRLSFVFPEWAGRFSKDTFRNLVAETVREQVPAHIFCRILWLDKDTMEKFENVYKKWLIKKVSDSEDIGTTAKELLNMII